MHPIRGTWALLIGVVSIAFGQLCVAMDSSPQKDPPFAGQIGVSAKGSIPDWPKAATAPKDAPNIVLIMLDDVGFADTSTFGGLAKTPTLDRLTAQGLRYNRFHTAAICSPTRAALLSGRNAHRVGYGGFGGVGYPGYDGIWKKNAVSVAEVLRRNGYSTAVFGKWHNTPYYEMSPIGPFDRWPTSLGFEYYYGFMSGLANQWEPRLWRNTVAVSPPATPEQGYHLTADIVDEAIRWMRMRESMAQERPYFMYLATGAAHHPHHVPREWIERHRGRFDAGWDNLRREIFARQKKLGVIPADTIPTQRLQGLPAWNSLTADQRQLFARQMEVYAAFIAHTDHEIGRLIEAINSGPRADNTLILYIVGDNGADGWAGFDGAALGSKVSIADQMRQMDELGSPRRYSAYYSAGWAWMGSTPFQGMKHMASHFGGTRNPLVVSWSARIKDRGGLRTQFAHVNDIAATLYEAAGIQFPDVVDGVRQIPLDGMSLVETFTNPAAAERHRVQYFEAEGNRAIYQDGWVAAASHYRAWLPVPADSPLLQPSQHDFSQDPWELYHVAEDFSQARDLAKRFPRKLQELKELFDLEARKNGVYPLGAGSNLARLPNWAEKERRRRFTFYPQDSTIIGPNLPSFSEPHRITVDAVIPGPGVEGVLLSSGDRMKGISLYVKDGNLIYENNIDGATRERVTSRERLSHGRVELTFDLDSDSIGRLFVNGRLVGERALSRNASSGIDIGRNTISPVSDFYQVPFAFTGTIEKVTVDIQ